MTVSLPLLEGLWRRPVASEKVVKEALHRYQAAKYIARWCSKKRCQRNLNQSRQQQQQLQSGESRRKKRRIESAPAAPQPAPARVPPLPASLSSHSYEHWLFQALDSQTLSVRQLAARILLRHKPPVDALLDHLQATTPSLGDVQCFGLLIELSGIHLRAWKWASRQIRRLACNHRSHYPTRLVLLIHYCHAVSLIQTEDKRRLFRDFIWSSPPMLSNFIAAHTMIIEQAPARGIHLATRLLAKLLDPNPTSSLPSNKIHSESVDLASSAATATAAATTTTTTNPRTLRPAVDRFDTEQVDMETIEEEEEDDEEEEEEGEELDDEEEEEEEKYEQNIPPEEEEVDSVHDDDEDDDEDVDDHNDEDQDDGNDDAHDDTHENNVEMTEAEHDIVDVVRQFEARLLDINDSEQNASRPSSSSREQEASPVTPVDGKRKSFFLQACLQVLNGQYPLNSDSTIDSLTTAAEQRLLLTVCRVIQPPKKPLNLKIFMRRAPTQEEFFRGSLTKNPVHLSQLAASHQEAPTVRHLRQYIADQLQMSETAELIELLCANKILNLDLKLHVVQQVLWKNHLLENSSSVFATGGGAPTFFSTSSGLSMVFSADRADRRQTITADTPASSLPPMVVTYRLAGVDGEATEDIVETLNDPDAPSTISSASSEEKERLMEKEFGLTKLVTNGRGIHVLLRSIQSHIKDTLRRIRRDDVVFKRNGRGKRCEKNLSLARFEKSAPCAGLVLLNYCTKLPSNCKKLVDARAPTILLRLLLDVLNAIDNSSSTDKAESSSDQNAQIVSNPTAVMLEELIETLASDISSDDGSSGDDVEVDQGSSTLPLLLSSLKTIYLGPQLRKVIAKLLPFLTYGLSALARELADNFESHVKVEKLSDCEAKEQPKTRRFVLMDTFVQVAVCLPPNDVCHSLRSELMKCGFVEKLIRFILEDMPDQPPPWSTALWPKASEKEDVADLEQSWKYYFLRSGIKTAIDMLVGLCRGHSGVQALLANYNDGRFINACHWIESTSDNKSVRIYLNGLGLLAETLLDELKENIAEVAKTVDTIRRRTRERKKEIADERRSKALVSMSSYGPIAGAAEERPIATETRSGVGDVIRHSASSFLAPVLGFFSPGTEGVAAKRAEQPAWLAEMEALEDETGLTCAVCQEGRTLQPSELLGLYCYVKKVSIPYNKCGGRSHIDGAILLMDLPSSLPTSLVGTPMEKNWFLLAKSIGDTLRSANLSYNQAGSGANRRPTQVTTTVSAGNAIHSSCHSKARAADRHHPKAPKSEWEGASVRNSRVNCNVVLPLVSTKSSKVPLVAVEMALSDYQTAIGNLLGARPKTMLWTVLNDVRLLLLRIAYGESLSADCGGGSLSSNSSLLFYQLLLADMYTNDPEHESPQAARHARCLSGGFLAACKIVNAEDYDGTGKSSQASLRRSIADAAPMAALTCIVYHNTKDEDSAQPEKDAMIPHPKRRWELNKEEFLCGMIACAGRRHALGVEDSGCQTSRKGRQRQSSFSDWEVVEDESADAETTAPLSTNKRKGSTSIGMGKRGLLKVDDFAITLRPMITLYSIVDVMSSMYVPSMTDEMIEDSAAVLVKHMEDCQQAKGIHDLLRKAGVKLDNDRIIEELQKGMVSA